MALHRAHMQELRFSLVERYFWANMNGSIGADGSVFGPVPQVDEHDVATLLSLRRAKASYAAWTVGLQLIMVHNVYSLARHYR